MNKELFDLMIKQRHLMSYSSILQHCAANDEYMWESDEEFLYLLNGENRHQFIQVKDEAAKHKLEVYWRGLAYNIIHLYFDLKNRTGRADIIVTMESDKSAEVFFHEHLTSVMDEIEQEEYQRSRKPTRLFGMRSAYKNKHETIEGITVYDLEFKVGDRITIIGPGRSTAMLSGRSRQIDRSSEERQTLNRLAHQFAEQNGRGATVQKLIRAETITNEVRDVPKYRLDTIRYIESVLNQHTNVSLFIQESEIKNNRTMKMESAECAFGMNTQNAELLYKVMARIGMRNDCYHEHSHGTHRTFDTNTVNQCPVIRREDLIAARIAGNAYLLRRTSNSPLLKLEFFDNAVSKLFPNGLLANPNIGRGQGSRSIWMDIEGFERDVSGVVFQSPDGRELQLMNSPVIPGITDERQLGMSWDAIGESHTQDMRQAAEELDRAILQRIADISIERNADDADGDLPITGLGRERYGVGFLNTGVAIARQIQNVSTNISQEAASRTRREEERPEFHRTVFDDITFN